MDRKQIFKSARKELGQMVTRFKNGYIAAEAGEHVDTCPHNANRSKVRRAAWLAGYNANTASAPMLYSLEAAAAYMECTPNAMRKRARNGKSAHWVNKQIAMGAA